MLALVLATILVSAPRARAPTVLDDFLSVPPKLLKVIQNLSADPAARKATLRLVDLKDGYLKGWFEDGSSFEVAMFVEKDGGHVLAMEFHLPDMGCADVEPVQFLARKAGCWVDVTRSVWPRLDGKRIAARVTKVVGGKYVHDSVHSQCGYDAKAIVWTLPRVGTTIFGKTVLGGLPVVLEWRPGAGKFMPADRTLLHGGR